MPNFIDAFGNILLAKSKSDSAKRLALAALLLVILFVAAGYYSAITREAWDAGTNVRGLPLTLSWGIIAGGIALFLAMVGVHVHDRVGGALITNRNLMSLSRLQLVSWTVLIISSFAAIALFRVFTPGVDDPLAIDVPSQVWQLLGLGAGSSLLTSVVNAQKKARPITNPNASQRAADALTEQQQKQPVPPPPVTQMEVDRDRHGTLYRNPSPADARFTDVFEGDEVGNTAYVDMSKVQMFLFTVITLITYAAAVFELLRGTDAYNLASLPEITPGMVTILGISHAAFLGNKAVDHTN